MSFFRLLFGSFRRAAFMSIAMGFACLAVFDFNTLAIPWNGITVHDTSYIATNTVVFVAVFEVVVLAASSWLKRKRYYSDEYRAVAIFTVSGWAFAIEMVTPVHAPMQAAATALFGLSLYCLSLTLLVTEQFVKTLRAKIWHKNRVREHARGVLTERNVRAK